VGTEQTVTRAKRKGMSFTSLGNGQGFNGCDESINQGRFPSNVILDEEAGALLDKQSGVTISGGTSGKPTKYNRKNVIVDFNKGVDIRINNNPMPSNFGGASRFFYCSKASSSERNAGMRWDSEAKRRAGLKGADNDKENLDDVSERWRTNDSKNHHATVKPLSLMRYLVRLVTPKGGIVLEPFAGSGTTLLAAKKEGFEFVGIERELEYCKIAEQRLEAVAINETLF
jgi:site-specific DNA-methyltransferase (adenine-specific)